MSDKSTKSFYTVSELAQRFDVADRTIRRWIAAGQFPRAYNLSTMKKSPFRIPVEDVEEFERARIVNPENNNNHN